MVRHEPPPPSFCLPCSKFAIFRPSISCRKTRQRSSTSPVMARSKCRQCHRYEHREPWAGGHSTAQVAMRKVGLPINPSTSCLTHQMPKPASALQTCSVFVIVVRLLAADQTPAQESAQTSITQQLTALPTLRVGDSTVPPPELAARLALASAMAAITPDTGDAAAPSPAPAPPPAPPPPESSSLRPSPAKGTKPERPNLEGDGVVSPAPAAPPAAPPVCVC